MTEITLRPEVQSFAEAIEMRLRKHDHDRGKSWRAMDDLDMDDYLAQRVAKLHATMIAAAVGVAESGEVRKQAASVGAAAMFAFDNWTVKGG